MSRLHSSSRNLFVFLTAGSRLPNSKSRTRSRKTGPRMTTFSFLEPRQMGQNGHPSLAFAAPLGSSSKIALRPQAAAKSLRANCIRRSSINVRCCKVANTRGKYSSFSDSCSLLDCIFLHIRLQISNSSGLPTCLPRTLFNESRTSSSVLS